MSTHDSRRATSVAWRMVVLLSATLTLVFLFSFFFSDRGIAELRSARGRVATLQSDIVRMQAENGRLRAEIDSVRRSTYAVERIAREDLGMARRGEIVYMLPKKN